MKRTLGAVLALVTLAAGAASAEPLRIATEGTYPPFNFVDQSGKVQGFDVDIANALCAEMKVDCTIETFAWDGMIPGLNSGKFDAIIASMSITPKREEAVSFTQPYYQVGAALVAAKGSDIMPTPEALAGKTVGVQRASSYGQLLAAKFPDAKLREYDKNDEHNLDLAAGRIDAVMAQRIYMMNWLEKPESADFEMKGEALKDSAYIGRGAGIALRKSDTELLAKFDAALAAIKSNGTYAEINAKYFPFSILPDSDQ